MGLSRLAAVFFGRSRAVALSVLVAFCFLNTVPAFADVTMMPDGKSPTPTPSVALSAESGGSAFNNLNKVEEILYGSPQTGGLIGRLSRAEKDLFGRELPGSLVERQDALMNFLERGSQGQPSFIFKLRVAEWLVNQKTNVGNSASEEISRLEELLEGQNQSGPLAMRLERLLTKLLPEGATSITAVLPAGTVAKVTLMSDLTVRNSKAGDAVLFQVASDVKVGNLLVAPQGSIVNARILSVSGPKSFGRASEIKVGFEDLQTIGMQVVPVTVGANAKKASEVENAVVGAAGLSVLGAFLLGPVGLAGGFLIRGDDRTIPAGSIMFVETSQEVSVFAYQMPPAMGGIPVTTQQQ